MPTSIHTPHAGALARIHTHLAYRDRRQRHDILPHALQQMPQQPMRIVPLHDQLAGQLAVGNRQTAKALELGSEVGKTLQSQGPMSEAL